MEQGVSSIWAFLHLILVFSYFHYVTPNAEGDALNALKSSLADPNGVLQSWDPTLVNPCTWFHVTCNSENSVTRVDLGNANLTGQLVTQLGQLPNLQYLELYSNNISGTVPYELGNLKNLVSLDLYLNNLSGPIPDTLGKLQKLRFLRLNNNTLSGEIPNSLTAITTLQVLDLSTNHLHGIVPTYGSFSMFTPISFKGNQNLTMPAVTPTSPILTPKSQSVGNRATGAIAGGVAAGAALLFAAPAIALAWWRRRKPQEHFFDVPAEEDPEVHLGQLKRFSLRELQVATDNFSHKNILGRGGFGKVYKGRLADGSLVAVKRLKEERTQGGELQFQTEVEMISMAVHRNLLRLRNFNTPFSYRSHGCTSMDHMNSGFTIMDLSSNEKPPYSTTIWNIRKSSGNLLADRLSVLPDELLIQILSLLPTTDAVVMSILSRKMRSVFPLITSLDFDDSPISYCLKHPNRIDRFPAFVSFVIKAIHTYQSEHLSRFRLRIGRDFVTRSFSGCTIEGTGPCDKCCFPDLKFPLLNILIGFPLSHHGLRELDLRIQVRKPGEDQLPSEIFTCDTLEALKLDVNLGLHQVFTMPFFHLPKLKLFHFTTSIVSEKDFLNKLVSSCPLLEDLTVQAWWKDFPFTTVSSPSLRRLCLKLYQRLTEENSNSLHINTPNLKSLDYYGNLAVHYDIQNMQRLVKADININNVGYTSVSQEVDDPLQRTLSLIRPLSIVQHLSLAGLYVQILDFYGVKDYLPVFRNLKYLELGYRQFYWDKVLLAFLNCSPVLETLVFPQGMINENMDMEVFERLKLEREFCRTTRVIPSCCRSHLKRIVIKKYMVTEREINLIQFLLRHALVLEELVIYVYQFPWRTWPPIEDRKCSLIRTLRELPRASVTCLIKVL